MSQTKSLQLGLIILTVFLFSCTTHSQEYVTQLDYFPSKKSNVTDDEYRKGRHMLEQTYAAIKNDGLIITYADHLNIARAFSILKEPKESVLNELKLAEEEDLISTAKIFALYIKSHTHYNLTQHEFDSLKIKFKTIYEEAQSDTEEIDLSKYANDNNLDEKLVKLIATIGKEDQKYRVGNINMVLQNKIDQSNMNKIDSLYSKYKTYIGRSLVGKNYESTMWAVIQHSKLEKQEEYLKVVQEAVISKELNETPFKMLIDRIFTKKYGYQIFGSQASVPLGNEEEIKKVKKEFSIK